MTTETLPLQSFHFHFQPTDDLDRIEGGFLPGDRVIKVQRLDRKQTLIGHLFNPLGENRWRFRPVDPLMVEELSAKDLKALSEYLDIVQGM